jgi:hypothetical protein
MAESTHVVNKGSAENPYKAVARFEQQFQLIEIPQRVSPT